MFKIVNVFDVSQTDGEPLPSLGVDELTGDVDRFNSFMSALETVSPAPIGYEDIPGGAHGYYDHVDRRIARGLLPLRRFCCLDGNACGGREGSTTPEASTIETI